MSIDTPGQGSTSGMTLDLHSLNALKAAAAKDPKVAIKGASKQLETLFMQELMKTMRASTLSSGMLENSGTQMGTEMLDTEFAGRMSGLPNGLSAAIERQLSKQIGGVKPGDADKAGATGATTAPTTVNHALPLSRLSLGALQSAVQAPGSTGAGDDAALSSLSGLPAFDALRALSAAPASSTPAAGAAATSETASGSASSAIDSAIQSASTASTASAATTASTANMRPPEAFVRKHQAAAQVIEAETGIPAANLIGQAAHESGWGKHEIKNKDGSSSHNLFGIKAGSSWTGKVAEVTTTEYIGGVPRRVTAKFRSYDSYEEAFRDHAKLLTSSPRYSNVVAQASTAQSYAKSLQKAGYATDPAYADKLTKVINTTLRLQRTVT
jgi:flagellar protein FlgJ